MVRAAGTGSRVACSSGGVEPMKAHTMFIVNAAFGFEELADYTRMFNLPVMAY